MKLREPDFAEKNNPELAQKKPGTGLPYPGLSITGVPQGDDKTPMRIILLFYQAFCLLTYIRKRIAFGIINSCTGWIVPPSHYMFDSAHTLPALAFILTLHIVL